MDILHTKFEVQGKLSKLRAEGRRVGVVPTMGALHEGHLYLIEYIKSRCDCLVLWNFVNPTQFESFEDYQRYPRDLEADCFMAGNAGVDLVFAPSVEVIYPAGLEAYYQGDSPRVFAGDRAFGFEGDARPGHFNGVVHVVLVFLNILKPDIAVFGEKDYQQVMVVRQMLDSLHLDVEICVAPLIREESGLALSSRNSLISKDDQSSLALSQGLMLALKMFHGGESSAAALEQAVVKEMTKAGFEIDYVAVVAEGTLDRLERVSDSARIIAAGVLNGVRLIDNIVLEKPYSR